MISLATQRMVLRPWVDDDLPWFQELCADAEVMRYIGDGTPRTADEAAASFSRIRQNWDRRGYGLLAIERLDSGQLAGFAGLGHPEFLPEIMPAVEIGWRLHRDAWGEGIGTEAAAAVLDWAFASETVDQIVAVIHVENKRSHRIAEKLGFRRERRTIVPENGVWADVHRLDRSSWSQQARWIGAEAG